MSSRVDVVRAIVRALKPIASDVGYPLLDYYRGDLDGRAAEEDHIFGRGLIMAETRWPVPFEGTMNTILGGHRLCLLRNGAWVEQRVRMYLESPGCLVWSAGHLVSGEGYTDFVEDVYVAEVFDLVKLAKEASNYLSVARERLLGKADRFTSIAENLQHAARAEAAAVAA